MCLSFAQIHTVQSECHRYQALALSKCGRPFQITSLFEQRQRKRLDLVQVIAEKAKENLEEWKREQEKKANAKYEKNEKDRLELMQQIVKNRKRKQTNIKIISSIFMILIQTKEKKLFVLFGFFSDNSNTHKKTRAVTINNKYEFLYF